MMTDSNVFLTMIALLNSLNYADTARMLFVTMYGDRHVPEFDCGVDDDGNAQLNVYMAGKVCCKIKRVIPCENIQSAEDPVNVVYKVLEDMHERLRSYEDKEAPK